MRAFGPVFVFVGMCGVRATCDLQCVAFASLGAMFPMFVTSGLWVQSSWTDSHGFCCNFALSAFDHVGGCICDSFGSVGMCRVCATCRVVKLSSYQLEVCCCCATCSDHGSLSSKVLFVAGISSCRQRLLRCFWKCGCKQARCEIVNCACDTCHFNRDEDEYQACWASCDGEKIHIEKSSQLAEEICIEAASRSALKRS